MNPPKADPSASSAARGTVWPIFVLSLEGDEARRAPLLRSLADMGLEAEVLIGVDGRDGLPKWAEAKVDRHPRWTWDHRPRRQMTDGELACALSHVRAYRKIIDEGLPGAIVFEDDAKIGAPFRRFVTARGYEAGQMVLLGHKRTWVKRNETVPILDNVTAHRLASAPFGAYAYALSNSAARYLLEFATPVRAQADWPCDISRLRSLAVDPQVVAHPADQAAQSILHAKRKQAPPKAPRYMRFLSGAFWARCWRRGLGRRIA